MSESEEELNLFSATFSFSERVFRNVCYNHEKRRINQTISCPNPPNVGALVVAVDPNPPNVGAVEVCAV